MRDQLEALNRDIWQPFVRAYHALDAATFLGLCRSDMIHASGAAGQVHRFEEYARQMREFFDMVAERGDQVDIEFRFSERLVADGVASERGLFRLSVTLADGELRTRYGRFHTFSVLTEGRWQFLVDYDTADGADEAAFDAATPVEDTSAFTG
jgi:hypothetical protein